MSNWRNELPGGLTRKLRGRSGTKEELLKEDQAAFLASSPFSI